MSTADCESGFSALKRIKTEIRNRLSCKVLYALMDISIEGPNSDDLLFEQACLIWARKRTQRIAL